MPLRSPLLRIAVGILALVVSSAFALAPSSALAAEPQTITATEGLEFKGQVVEVSGLQCDKASEGKAEITWGDGHESPGTVTFLGNRHLTVSAGVVQGNKGHTYAAAGKYNGTVKGTYSCQGDAGEFTDIAFVANVAAAKHEPPPPTETTPTQPTPPPPPSPAPAPPPVVRAAFTLASVTPGGAVLDASPSAPSGTSVARYSWSIGGAAQPDAVCQGSQPQLTVMTRDATDTTIALTAVDAQGATTSTQQTLEIPAPLAGGAKIARAAALGGHVAARTAARPFTAHRLEGTAVTPAFTVLAECAGKAKADIPALTFKGRLPGGAGVTAGGAPPAECNQDVEFGAADVFGCLKPIAEPGELPGGITAVLATLLCGSHAESFCMTPLRAAANFAGNFLSGALDEATESRVNAGGASNADDTSSNARETAITEPRAAAAVDTALRVMGYPSYYSWDPVRIDGLDIDPRNGQPILVIPSASVVVSADASIYLHGIPISPIHTLALYLPANGGALGEISLPHKVPIIGSLPFSGDIGIALKRAGATLSNGDTCAFDCAAISVEADLPGVFSGAGGHGLSAAAVITADDQEGLELDSLEAKLEHAEIAGIGVNNLDFRYRRGDDSLRGGATVDLNAAGEVTASFAFVHGSFQEAHVAWSAGAGPGVDLGGPIPIFLTQLGGGLTVNPPVVTAEGAIAGGGNVLGCSLFGISGKLTIQFAPFDLNAEAAGELLCNHVAEEYFHVDEAGDIGLGGNVKIEIYVISFEAGIAFEVSQGHFQFDGNVNACLHLLYEPCLGAEVVVSDHGVGACADLGFTHAGAGIVFPDETHFMLDSCDIAQFRSLPMPANLASLNDTNASPLNDKERPGLQAFPASRDPLANAAQALPSFTVPRGDSVAALGVVGAGGAPNVTLRGPEGRTIVTPADGYSKDSSEVVIADGKKTMETYFFINHPAPGKWTIESDPGSVAVSAVQQSAALPSPDLHARVTRARGGRERLRYSLRAIPGQNVSFVEREKGHGFRMLGQAHGSHGTIPFTPSTTLGHRREIVAWVSENGQPREDLTLAHYAVPPPPRLPAPAGLKARRGGATVTLRWHAIAGASGYSVSVRLATGVREHYALGAPAHGAPSVTVSAPSYLGVRVSVTAQAQGKAHRAGRSATVRLRPGPQPRGVAVKPLRF